jgi:Arc/MetJ-type ribon-helix-helix transcriptional regulator
MRDIVNISLTPELSQIVKKGVREGHFASTSEFFRHILRTYELARNLKSEFTPTLAQKRALVRAERNFKNGKTLSYDELVQSMGFGN